MTFSNMLWWARYKLRLEVLETGGSWFVERNGRTVALLTDPQFVEMFWHAWRLEPLPEDPDEREAILSSNYWDPAMLSQTIFRSREYDTVADAFWAGTEPVREGRLVVRALYQPIAAPRPWDRVMLWVRRWLGRKGRSRRKK
jgi:hypothetical protein